MYKKTYGLIFSIIVPILSTNILAEDLNQVDYQGMQIAFVFLPSKPTSDEVEDQPKPKLKPISNQSPAIKPTETPAPRGIEAPAAEPLLQQQPPASKPTPAPFVKPAASPVQAVTVKPVQPYSNIHTHPFEWVIGLGLDVGGEEIGKLYYTDGSSASVKANNGVAINVGGILGNRYNSAFSTQITLGYKYGGPRGANGDVTWSAIPLDVIEYYRPSSLRMGLGLSYQINPQLSVNIPASSYINKYNNAIGLIAQIGWAPAGEHYSIDLRYTSIKFQPSDVPGAPTVNGSVAGLYTSYRF
jgi:hypothetical protein